MGQGPQMHSLTYRRWVHVGHWQARVHFFPFFCPFFGRRRSESFPSLHGDLSQHKEREYLPSSFWRRMGRYYLLLHWEPRRSPVWSMEETSSMERTFLNLQIASETFGKLQEFCPAFCRYCMWHKQKLWRRSYFLPLCPALMNFVGWHPSLLLLSERTGSRWTTISVYWLVKAVFNSDGNW